MDISNVPLIFQVLIWIGIWLAAGIVAAAFWLIAGILFSILLGGWLPGIFFEDGTRRGMRRIGTYFGLAALFGPFTLLGIPLAFAED